MSYLMKQLSRFSQEKKWLLKRIEMIKKSPDGAKMWLKDLGKNGFEHAEAIEEYISKILYESKVRLSPEETYLLLHSIYLHDIGYRIGKKEHSRNTYKMITQNPERFFIYDKDLAEGLALICLSHGIDDLSHIPNDFAIDFLNKTKEFDLRFLGSLLRLGDEMDQGYLRVFNRKGQQESPRNNVYHIEIGPQIIKLKTKPLNKYDWEELKKIRDTIQMRLEQTKEILYRSGIKLEHVFLYPTVWAEEPKHIIAEKDTVPKSPKDTRPILFLLDGTVLGYDFFQAFQIESKSTAVIPIYYTSPLTKQPFPVKSSYSAIVLFNGESYNEQLPSAFAEKIEENTKKGGGLVLFPFMAWSVSQGINDMIENLMPVDFTGSWHENKSQYISKIESHDITSGIKSFTINNTYEELKVKKGAKCLIADLYSNPFLTICSYGKGRVAYINTSSHLCYQFSQGEKMISPWQQSVDLRNIILQTLKWACGK